MSFLNRFQYHYHTKNIDGFISSENYDEFFKYLNKVSDNKDLFYKLSLKYISKAINSSKNNFINKKIVWMNSFMKNDLDFLNKFFLFYNQGNGFLYRDNQTYLSAIDDILIKNEEIDFNTFINQSYFFQWMILNNNNSQNQFFINELPFFSTKDNFNFTKPNITQSYIFLLNDPYVVYNNIKTIHDGDQQIARNVFLNLDNKPTLENFNKATFNLSKQGWHTNTLSWTDPNVLNSLKGKIILKKDLIREPYETLSSIILHLVQSGVEIELNYDLIEKFVKQNPISNESGIEVSQKEKKFIDQYIDQILNTYEF